MNKRESLILTHLRPRVNENNKLQIDTICNTFEFYDDLTKTDLLFEIIGLHLNSRRNSIIKLSLIMETLAVATGSCAVVGSIFGKFNFKPSE